MQRTRRKFNVGDKYGSWTILEYPFKSRKALLRCDCGTEGWYWLANLSSHKSMSCRECLVSTPWERVFKSVKVTAARRKIDWNLSFEEWKSLAQDNCHYCSSPPSNCLAVHKVFYNGIDRVDTNKDYSLDNCVSACKVCNRSKSNMPLDEFLEWIGKVHARSLQI